MTDTQLHSVLQIIPFSPPPTFALVRRKAEGEHWWQLLRDNIAIGSVMLNSRGIAMFAPWSGSLLDADDVLCVHDALNRIQEQGAKNLWEIRINRR